MSYIILDRSNKNMIKYKENKGERFNLSDLIQLEQKQNFTMLQSY